MITPYIHIKPISKVHLDWWEWESLCMFKKAIEMSLERLLLEALS